MKKILALITILFISLVTTAQKVDSIYFHLYTDSLKKGQNNYINVDGKYSDGRWQPLTAKDIILTCTKAEFAGNDLIIPADFVEEKVTVKAVLKSNPAVSIEKTIWIKKLPDPDFLPTKEDILNQKPKKNKIKNSET
jgi:hypothetical protein